MMCNLNNFFDKGFWQNISVSLFSIFVIGFMIKRWENYRFRAIKRLMHRNLFAFASEALDGFLPTMCKNADFKRIFFGQFDYLCLVKFDLTNLSKEVSKEVEYEVKNYEVLLATILSKWENLQFGLSFTNRRTIVNYNFLIKNNIDDLTQVIKSNYEKENRVSIISDCLCDFCKNLYYLYNGLIKYSTKTENFNEFITNMLVPFHFKDWDLIIYKPWVRYPIQTFRKLKRYIIKKYGRKSKV